MSTIGKTELLRPQAAAAILGVRKNTLAAWRCSGRHRLPYVRIGRAVRYRQEDIDQFIRERRENFGAEKIGH